MAHNGVPSHTLMEMGGWSSIETVQQFHLKTSDENKKRAVEMLDRLMGEERLLSVETIVKSID